MKQFPFLMPVAALALAACSTAVPDSGAGVTASTLAAEADAAVADGAPVTAVTISDEQDFQAVSGRETIESDAARIAANRTQYQIIEPSELPERSGNNQALVVQYALATNNPVGASLYRRSGVGGQARHQRACNKYSRADEAQAAFLGRGGPKRDPMGLDPDGDGFACSWDPTPFRLARAGGEDLETAAPMNIDDTH
jgi:hypothetical protein